MGEVYVTLIKYCHQKYHGELHSCMHLLFYTSELILILVTSEIISDIWPAVLSRADKGV